MHDELIELQGFTQCSEKTTPGISCYSVTALGVSHMQIHVPSISIVSHTHTEENTAEQEWEVSISFEESLSLIALALNTFV